MVILEQHSLLGNEPIENLCSGRAWPLPRVSERPRQDVDAYEVIVVGAGPAGLFLTLQLARYGLDPGSLLCIDSKKEHIRTGHADGINARTIEILRTFGLEAEVVRDGTAFSELAHWCRSPKDPPVLERMMCDRFYQQPARYDQLRTLNQGRVERFLKADLIRYHSQGVDYSTVLTHVELDEAGSPEYPVLVTLEHEGQTRAVRTKYLVGADGAHSIVRKCLEIGSDGDISDRIWGVMDFICDTDFPDIRRVTNFQGKGSGRGDALIVPRERLSDGSHLTRLYVDMTEYEDEEDLVNGTEHFAQEYQPKSVDSARTRRTTITPEQILQKGQEFMCQYRFQKKKGTEVFWWAAYSVGQRLANQFTVDDTRGHPRIFLAGDACHTHSPRQGQGMNVSMQDSYNLGWKLAHALFGLTPHPAALLHTYETERRSEASKLVFFDKRWNQSGIELADKLNEMREQVLGCGAEYGPSMLVDRQLTNGAGKDAYPVTGTGYLDGILRAGRRLLNVTARRFADGAQWDIHDDLISNGRYRILVVCGDDFPNPQGRSLPAVEHFCSETVKGYVDGMVEVMILQPDMKPTWDFVDLPCCIKEKAEMSLYCAGAEIYDTYGLDRCKGAVVVVRPDGVVSMITQLEDVAAVDKFLQHLLVTV